MDSGAGDSRVLRALRAIISGTFKRFNVKKSVVFAVDGVPPLAKLAASQQRRQRAARMGLLSACIEESLRPKETHEEAAGASSFSREHATGRASIPGEAEGECDGRKGGAWGKSGYSIRRRDTWNLFTASMMHFHLCISVTRATNTQHPAFRLLWMKA